MRPDETFTKNHYRVSIDVKAVSQLKNVVLENVDDAFSKLVCISLATLYEGLQYSVESILIWFLISA